MPYDDTDLGQHWLRLIACCLMVPNHFFNNPDLLLSVGFSVIHLKAITLKDAHYLLLWSTHGIHRAVWLTHWGRVTHICVGNLTIIGLDNGLLPGRRQAIIWNNAGILLIGPLGTNFNEILIKFHTISFNNIHLKIIVWKMASILSRPQCVNHDGCRCLVSKPTHSYQQQVYHWKCCIRQMPEDQQTEGLIFNG